MNTNVNSMHRVFTVLFCISLIHAATSQVLGIKATNYLTTTRDVNNAFGGGLYLYVEDSTVKFGIALLGDFVQKSDSYDNCLDCITMDVSTYYRNVSFGISSYWKKKIYPNVNFKAGPMINYNFTNGNRQGQHANWIETSESRYLGLGMLLNFQYEELFKLPLNFDVFITPTYLIPLKSESYLYDMSLINLEAGLSYIIK